MHFRNLLYLLAIFSMLWATSAFSQDKQRIDSVKTALKDRKLPEKVKCKLLAQLGWDASYYDLNEGLKYAEEALAIAQKNNFTKELAYALNVAGTIYMDLGNYPMAMDYLHKASKQYASIGDKRGAAVASGNLGIIYTRRGEYRKALQYFFVDYYFFKDLGGNGLISSYLNLGSTYRQIHLYDSALYYLNLGLARNDLDSLQRSSMCSNMASVYTDLGDLKKGKEYVMRAIALINDSTQGYYLAEDYLTLSAIEAKERNFPAAIAAASRALEFSKAIGVKEFEKNCYENLSGIYEEQGNLSKALEYYKLRTALHDSLVNTENDRSMKFMETRFEIDNKQKEIELLSKDKKLRDERIQHDAILIRAFICGGIILLLALSLAIYAFVNKRKANRKLHSLNNEIHKQKNQLLEKNQAITDSIQYALRIQHALLTSEEYIKKHLPDFFILNIPKDIVSGDFYWAYAYDSKMYFMCADCTGHGVPGAFMSLLGINFLNEIVIEKGISSPDQVLNELRREIIQSLNKQGGEETKDGMDCTLCAIDTGRPEVQIASANNAVWIVRPPASPMQTDEKGILKMAPGFKFTEISPDKMPVGKSPKDHIPFTLKNYPLKKGDCIYMFSDGFADQFGGPKGKKMKYKLLKEIIFKNCHLPMQEQKEALRKNFTAWKANFEQVDDVLLIGIRV